MSGALASRGRAAWLAWRHRGSLATLRRSGLFDGGEYLRRNPDVAASGVDPALHYLRSGWREGRDPHPLFDVRGYLAGHPEVHATGAEPFLHFLARAQEPIAPRPDRSLVLFDADDEDDADRLTAALASGGMDVVSASTVDWRRWEAAVATCASVIFWRTPAEGEGALALLRATQFGRRRLWGADDLCFEPNIFLDPGVFDALPPERRRAMIAGAPPRRAALATCDVSVGQGEAIAAAMREAGARHVVRWDGANGHAALIEALRS